MSKAALDNHSWVLLESFPQGLLRGGVVLTELPDLRIELRIKPIHPDHGCLEVVDDQGFGHATEMAEAVFQAANELLGRLAPHHLAVALARVDAEIHPFVMLVQAVLLWCKTWHEILSSGTNPNNAELHARPCISC